MPKNQLVARVDKKEEVKSPNRRLLFRTNAKSHLRPRTIARWLEMARH